RIQVWEENWEKASLEFSQAHPSGSWPGVNKERLLAKRTHRHLIDVLVRDVVAQANHIAVSCSIESPEQARRQAQPVVGFSPEVGPQVDRLLSLMMNRVYKSPLILRQNHRASHIMSSLFQALVADPGLLPSWVSSGGSAGEDPSLTVAHFLAGLTDRSAADLYAELFEPGDRAMGHRIL
ncbi:MAG: hypothetical protein NTU41_14575, partial [Chloroflexi bacterium]|nr:hypothetical protein [Chloroflexota bacterium]